VREFINQLSWLQRHEVSIRLYKGDWRGAVSAVPEALRPELHRLCDLNGLMVLAVMFDPATEGVHVETERRDFDAL
jgi:hypothetical protein